MRILQVIEINFEVGVNFNLKHCSFSASDPRHIFVDGNVLAAVEVLGLILPTSPEMSGLIKCLILFINHRFLNFLLFFSFFILLLLLFILYWWISRLKICITTRNLLILWFFDACRSARRPRWSPIGDVFAHWSTILCILLGVLAVDVTFLPQFRIKICLVPTTRVEEMEAAGFHKHQ